MSGLQRFADLVTRDQFDLAEACFLIGTDIAPGLDIAAGLAQLEAIAESIRTRLPADAFAEQRLVALNRTLFDEMGFRGNTENYYDPRNSYLHEVLARRTGIPITLSVLYIEIGRRIGLPLYGVSFPGHFLVKLRVSRGQLVLDPFAAGEPQSQATLQKRLEQAAPRGEPRPIDLDRYLAPATPRQIVLRMLRNLKAIYLEKNASERALGVLNRLVLVLPESAEELRDRGLVFERLEAFRAALSDLENYLRRRPDAPDAFQIHAKAVELRQRCARLN